MKKILIILSLLLSFNAHAENWYRVELIVFENTYPLTGGELWNKYPGLPDTGNAVKLTRQQGGSTTDLVPFQILDPSLFTLSGAYSKLQKSSQYKPLSYLA